MTKFLRDVCRVPELDGFGAESHEAQVIGTLRPGNVDNLLLRPLSNDELLLTLDIINRDFMVV